MSLIYAAFISSLQWLQDFVSTTPNILTSWYLDMMESIQKRLTVTFKDVAVQVASLGEDYGATVASVVTDLIPSFGKAKHRYLMLNVRRALPTLGKVMRHCVRLASQTRKNQLTPSTLLASPISEKAVRHSVLLAILI